MQSNTATGGNGAGGNDTVPDIAVVVPALNEQENVVPLAREIVSALDGIAGFEIIFVDDGSDDETVPRLKAFGREEPRLRIVCHERRAGQSGAIRTGIRAARAGLIATLDGDGQNDPADIPALLARYRALEGQNVGMIAGERRKRQDNALRRLSSRIANGVRSSLLDDGVMDTGCGLKLFPRSLYLDLPYFDHQHRFLPALVQRQGQRVVTEKVNHRPRGGGRSKYGVMNRLWVGIVDICGVLWLKRRARGAAVSFYECAMEADRDEH